MSRVLNFLTRIFGNKYDSDINKLKPIVESINSEVKRISNLKNDELREITESLKNQIKKHTVEKRNLIKKKKEEAVKNEEKSETLFKQIDEIESDIIKDIEIKLNEILPLAFAVVKETAIRFKKNEEIVVTANEFDKNLASNKDFVTISGSKAIYKNSWTAAGNKITWDMVHYDVQLIGGIVLHDGKIAEMQTGEGKTLSATLPIYLNALTGLGVHLVTVNNYLAKRDAEWMGPIFQFHGLSVDCIDNHAPNSDERKRAYKADITYGTNNEFGFDYLRDNMSRRVEDLVQRKLNFSIVDEVDSVLIDDARTPLIISGPTPKGDQHEYNELKHKVSSLYSEQKKYVSKILFESKQLLKDGNKDKGGFLLLRSYRGLPKNKALIKFLSEDGIRAQLQKTENFYMQDQSKEMHKVDEELFFTIDEKNNSIELTEKGINLITKFTEDKNFFIMPNVGAEISKIQNSNISEKNKQIEKDKLMTDFSVKSERIHSVNQLLKAYTLFEKDTEYVVIDNKVKIVDEQTGRIMEGRRYSDGLHQAIEAKENVKIESASQTYATVTLQNYFRMYNKLSGMTGTAETEAGEFWEIYKLDVVVIPTNKPIQRKDKNDLVYKTNREKYNAVIEEIDSLSKKGRPILVGTTSVEISELLSKILNRRKIKHNVLNAKLHQKEADIVAEAGKESIVTIATNMAGRGTDIKLSEKVKDNGGLAIIGTERHDSRRVDRQLRGRSGRQGDPGSSQFYVSLEDNLMRLFGSERIAKIMDRMGLEDGEVIQHSMVSRSIERAQKKVEENNFGIRKRLLEYDDVMNQQREVIYKKRRHALFGDRLSADIINMFYDTCDLIVENHFESKNFSEFKFDLMKFLSIESPVNEKDFKSNEKDKLTELVFNCCYSNYKKKSDVIATTTFPIIEDVYKNQSDTYKNIVIPFTDGIKTMNVVTNLEETFKNRGHNIQFSIEKSITLNIIDEIWKEHLREMDELKQSVQNAVYEQKDPLLIYKFESFNLFKLLLEKINKDIISFLIKSNLPNQSNVQDERIEKIKNLKTSRTELLPTSNNKTSNNHTQRNQPVRTEKKIGRNEKITISNGTETKELKWKKAKPLIDGGQWQRI